MRSSDAEGNARTSGGGVPRVTVRVGSVTTPSGSGVGAGAAGLGSVFAAIGHVLSVWMMDQDAPMKVDSAANASVAVAYRSDFVTAPVAELVAHHP